MEKINGLANDKGIHMAIPPEAEWCCGVIVLELLEACTQYQKKNRVTGQIICSVQGEWYPSETDGDDSYSKGDRELLWWRFLRQT